MNFILIDNYFIFKFQVYKDCYGSELRFHFKKETRFYKVIELWEDSGDSTGKKMTGQKLYLKAWKCNKQEKRLICKKMN